MIHLLDYMITPILNTDFITQMEAFNLLFLILELMLDKTSVIKQFGSNGY